MITTFGPLGWARTGTVVTAHPVVSTTLVTSLTKMGDPDMNAGHSTPGDQDDVMCSVPLRWVNALQTSRFAEGGTTWAGS